MIKQVLSLPGQGGLANAGYIPVLAWINNCFALCLCSTNWRDDDNSLRAAAAGYGGHCWAGHKWHNAGEHHIPDPGGFQGDA